MIKKNRITPIMVIVILVAIILLLSGFLLNQITMFVDFFTVKNTIITILFLYVIVANWVIFDFHLKKIKDKCNYRLQQKELHHEILKLEDRNRSLREEVADLK